jgi:hypothetical protein
VPDAIEDQGIEFEPQRRAKAEEIYAGLRPGIERLRLVPLSFLDPVVEPAAAAQWIECGGED